MPKMTEDQVVAHLTNEIRRAEDVAYTESSSNLERYKYYRAKKFGNEEEGRSKICDTTVTETVEWILPALEEILLEDNEQIDIQPVMPEDEDAADAMSKLLAYQFYRQSLAKKAVRQAIKKGLLFRPGGIVKYCWEKDVSEEAKTWEGLNEDEMQGVLDNPYNFEVRDVKAVEGAGFNVEGVFRTVEYDGPRFYSVPDGEFLRHPNAKDIKNSPFVAHKTKVTADYLLRKEKEGFYSGVSSFLDEGAKDNATSSAGSLDSASSMAAQDGLSVEPEHSSDPARREFMLYECYILIDEDGDGLLENRRIDMVDQNIFYDEINEYKYPPFIKFCSIDDIDKFSGIPISEFVEDITRLRTFLLRQMVNNMAQANNSRKVFDPTMVNQADLLDNRPGAAIRVVPGADPKNAIFELVTQPFSETTFRVLEYVTSLAEQRTGVSKTVKSIGDQYNETFSGQMAALNQASQRIKQIAKIMSEDGMEELFRAMIYMNKKFLTQSVFVRLEGKFLEIAPDDLEGRMDLVVNVIMGQATRQQTLVNIQQMIATYGQIQQSTGIPMLDGNNLPTMMREYVKAMGYKNQDKWLPLVLLQKPEQANEQLGPIMAMLGGGNGSGGATVGSVAGAGTGAGATTNPSGAGLPAAGIQPGSG